MAERMTGEQARRTSLLATYTAPGFWARHRKKCAFGLLSLAFFYGAAFGLTTTYFLLQLAVPLVILAAAVVWLLPESEAAPIALLGKLLFVFLAVLLIWPDYLAITLPGMPWITAVRLVGVPLAFVLFVTLSISGEVRRDLMRTCEAVPMVWRLLTIFFILCFVAVPVSTDVSLSTSKLLVALLNWFLIFAVAVYALRMPGAATRLAYMLWIIAILVSVIGVQEWRHSSVPWAGHIPSFLTVQDETVQRILSGSARAATGKYRVQSKFTTSLGLAEFYAFVAPIIIHFCLTARSIVVRLLAGATLPFLFWMILLTDSRLGVVGFILAGVLYIFVWALWRWRRDPDSLIGPTILLLYPAVFVAVVTATFFVGRLRAIVWGNGAQQASNDSRMFQITSGLPKVLARPWGYGMGRGAETLGFANGNGVLTIDTYYLSIALEYGIIGFIVYFAMFLNGIWHGAKRLPHTFGETDLLAPFTIALVNFVVIKAIFSQQDNHALVFAMLGAVVALCWRVDNMRGKHAGTAHDEQPAGGAPVPVFSRSTSRRA